MTPREVIIREGNLTKIIDRINIQDSKVAIVGGHYMLLYEKKSNSLKPAVYQEFEEGGNLTFSKRLTQNFPVKSFEFTVQLFQYLKFRKVDSRCVLLVNDDSFLRKDFRNEEHYQLIKDQGARLRKLYFSTEDHIPSIYRRILSECRIRLHDFFAIFENPHWSDESLLPRETLYVSERRLCRSFKKTVKSRAAGDSLFKIIKVDHSGVDNINELTVEASHIESICLIKEGICNCGGKTFQFYLDIIKNGFDTIIFFVPDECKIQVKEGTELFCNSPIFAEKIRHIINVTNVESNPDSPVREKELVINYYSNQSKLENKRN